MYIHIYVLYISICMFHLLRNFRLFAKRRVVANLSNLRIRCLGLLLVLFWCQARIKTINDGNMDEICRDTKCPTKQKIPNYDEHYIYEI